MKKAILLFVHYLGLPFVTLAFLISYSRLKAKAKKYVNLGEAYLAVDRYRVLYKLAKKLLFMKNIKVKTRGLEKIPKKPVLFVLNHKSQIDPIVLIKCLFEQEGLPYFSILSKVENQNKKRIKAAMDLIDTIYVDRGNMRQQYESYEEQINAIKQTRSIVVFPEGTRIYEDNIAEFKSAALKVAKQTYIPIVTILIYGSSGLFDSNKTYKNKRKTIYLEVLDVINYNQFATTKEEYIAEHIQQKMQKRYQEMLSLDKLNKPLFLEE